MKNILFALLLPLASALPAEVAHAYFVKAAPSEWCKVWKADPTVDPVAIKAAIEGDGEITVALHAKGVVYYKQIGYLVVFMIADPGATQETLIDGHVAG